MSKQIEIYILEGHYFDPCHPKTIIKKVIKKDKDVLVKEGANGRIDITIKDAYQNGHNGDWEDDHIVGYKTFNDAKKVMLEQLKEMYKDKLEEIKLLEE